MKTWQLELDNKPYRVSFDAQQSPPVIMVNDKPISLTPKLVQKGQAYNFMLNKHQATIQSIPTDEGLKVILLVDGQRIQSKPKQKAETAKLTHIPKYDTAGIFKRKQLHDEHRVNKKNMVRQIIPDWAWVAIIGILFIPAFSQLQTPSIILAGGGIAGVVMMANIPKMKEIHRFAFTIMWMCFCWSAFVIMSSRGIIRIDNLPLF